MPRGGGGAERERGRWAVRSVAFEPKQLVRADGLAALRGWSRSRLVREALAQMLATTGPEAATR